LAEDDVAAFGEAVNMAAGELETWLLTEQSTSVGQRSGSAESTGHQSGRRIVEILRTKKGDYTDADRKHMRKVALVTGASSGIGEATAIALAAEGAAVAIAARRGSAGVPARQAVPGRRPGRGGRPRRHGPGGLPGPRSRPRSTSSADSTSWSTTRA